MSYTPEEKVELLMRKHYAIMARPGIWYQPHWLKATTALCVMASDLRKQLREGSIE